LLEIFVKYWFNYLWRKKWLRIKIQIAVEDGGVVALRERFMVWV
jgi:hypothetical protein